MAKGFKDSSGKFRPTGNKGVSSRKKSVQAVGMSLQKMDDEGDITPEQIELLDELQAIETDVGNNFDKILFKTSLSKGCDVKDGKLIRTKLTEEEPALLPEGTQIEEFCGAITEVLEEYIKENYGEGFACKEQGMYVGEGAENSAGFVPSVGVEGVGNEVRHEWIRLVDGSIMDASAGQFIEDKDSITNEDRLRIIPPEDPRQDWYSSLESSGTCSICLARLVGGKCPTPDNDKIFLERMEKRKKKKPSESDEDFAHRMEEERMNG